MATRVADMSVDDLRILIHEVVLQTLEELFFDPDKGLEFREDFKNALGHSVRAVQVGDETLLVTDVATKLGLSW